MTTLSLTDIIGPIMVGPSSSHTAGALRIAYMARRLCPETPRKVTFSLLGSFAHTLSGHGTDKALVAGILGLDTDDLRIRESFHLAREAHLNFSFIPLPDSTDYDHPNTIDISLEDEAGNVLAVRGESVGGGAAVIRSIDGISVYITGENTSIVVRQLDRAGVLAHIAQTLSRGGINIATTRMYRERRGTTAYTILETDDGIDTETEEVLKAHPDIFDVRVIPANTFGVPSRSCAPNNKQSESEHERLARTLSIFETVDFASGDELLRWCEENDASISRAILTREAALADTLDTTCDIPIHLHSALQIMKESATTPLTTLSKSMGGLLGGEAQKLHAYAQNNPLCDQQLSKATAYAMAVLETNASMGRIVAAPTAGSSGVLPGVLLALQETRGYTDEELVDALACAGAIGYLITRNATVSGAEGGCQAEVGSAAAMAAAAAVQLAGGSAKQCFDAASNALTNLMGLVCDPVAGLVEVPCQKRNAAGAAVALVSAHIACAGIGNLVDFDQTVMAMDKVGRALPFELRESALGGIAATPTACSWCQACSASL